MDMANGKGRTKSPAALREAFIAALDMADHILDKRPLE
jgi:hypothetical protein